MGQINPESEFGSLIKKIAGESSIKSIVDIGAWNGLGTTRCIMEGITGRTDDVHVYSYENNKEFWEIANKNWNDDRISITYGHLSNRILSREEYQSHPRFAPAYNLWYESELKSFEESPIVDPPEKIDFVIFDGGEFSTIGDWDVISKYNPKYIGLDDTHVIKCYDINSELEKNTNYIKIASGTDRNGWALFKYMCY